MTFHKNRYVIPGVSRTEVMLYQDARVSWRHGCVTVRAERPFREIADGYRRHRTAPPREAADTLRSTESSVCARDFGPGPRM